MLHAFRLDTSHNTHAAAGLDARPLKTATSIVCACRETISGNRSGTPFAEFVMASLVNGYLNPAS
jgi:hypothetical protein